MNTYRPFKLLLPLLALVGLVSGTRAQSSYNVWRGDEVAAEWSNPYKWNLKHPPTGTEAVHFREDASVVTINQTLDLSNGMLLFGKELTLAGHGNINLTHVVPHQRTVNIPATAEGRCNLTLNESLSLNALVALAAKAFGTSASKGSLTLRNATSVSGTLAIGNDGCGTGKVYVHDDATYHITELQLTTRAKDGGAAEIHILGGRVRLATSNPFMPFFEDSSRKIIIGDTGSLRIETDLDLDQKVQQFKALIQNKRLVAASGCRLTPPIIDNNTILIKAEDLRNGTAFDTQEKLMAAIDQRHQQLQAEALLATANEAKAKLETLVEQKETPAEQIVFTTTDETTPLTAETAPTQSDTSSKTTSKAIAGYVVFFGPALLMIRRPKREK